MVVRHKAALMMVWRFAFVLVPAVVVLGVLNALPQFLGAEPLGVVRYASVEDAEARLGVRLYRPAALPRGWRWPPSRVRVAVGRPDWVEFVFEKQAGDTAVDLTAADGDAEAGALVMCQSVGRSPAGAEVPAALLAGGNPIQVNAVSMDGRLVWMHRVLLDDGTIVHELWWQEGAGRVMLRGRMSADNLPGVARVILGSR